MPTEPPTPPVTLTTLMFTFSALAISAMTSRLARSVPPPAAQTSTLVMSRVGYSACRLGERQGGEQHEGAG